MPRKRHNFTILLSLLFLALLTRPVLSVFNKNVLVLGIPLLYLYLLAVVSVLVLLLWLVTRNSNKHKA